MKVLIDTSAWIEHFKGRTEAVRRVLLDDDTEILVHRMVIAELLLGGLKEDSMQIELLSTLRLAKSITEAEILDLIAGRDLKNKGVGYVDCCLLASCLLEDAAILTFDTKLRELASELDIATAQTNTTQGQ